MFLAMPASFPHPHHPHPLRRWQMFACLEATKKVLHDADKQFHHFHAVMAKPTT